MDLEPAPGGTVDIAWAMKHAGLVASTSEGRRLVEQGGVEVDGKTQKVNCKLEPGKEYLVRVGSKNRRFARIRVKG